MKQLFQTLLMLRILLLLFFVRAFPPGPAFSPSPLSCRRSSYVPSSWWLHRRREHSSSSKDANVIQDATDINENSNNDTAPIDSAIISQNLSNQPPPINIIPARRKLELAWCNDSCYEAIREKVVGEQIHMEPTGPATGQVVYSWEQYSTGSGSQAEATLRNVASPPAVVMLVKRDDDELLVIAVETIKQLMNMGVQVLVDPALRRELENLGIHDLESDMLRLFDPQPLTGFGTGEQLTDPAEKRKTTNGCPDNKIEEIQSPADLSDADLVVTLGGDGLLMYAAHIFSGPVPPILPVAGGSMGFLTPFAKEEMLEAILISLGLRQEEDDPKDNDVNSPNGLLQKSHHDNKNIRRKAEKPWLGHRNTNPICISMRMRLDCQIIGSDTSLRSRYTVLNEVVIDRGSSPYLASLECFCDDVHLTTVQADGIIFSTPTGSTAYSMAAGGSVVHPAVPAILVTPICPHVLSFRSMVFPDHVVLRCYVPNDARSTACVYFDGKHHTELRRGDSVQIRMFVHPVPTINRVDHSADWLSSLKRNFNFNTRVRQNPL